jgi:hypothetical protein
MTYYRSTRTATRAPRTASSGPRANTYAGPCDVCAVRVPAGAGLLTGSRGAWKVRHAPARWVGSPVSGQWVGGCDDSATVEASEGKPAKVYGYTSTGARMTDRFSRCEDAPCCGCCD